MKFSELKFESMGAMQDADAIRAIVDLGNGYEVSVIKHQQSGGGREGLYEIALLGIVETFRRWKSGNVP